MSETEALAIAAAGGLTDATPRHTAPRGGRGPGDPCLNCETVLEGSFCHACGQSADDFQRPIGRLILDAIGDTFAFDGRLWRTLPALIFRPGHVTKAYLAGRRARFVPPFRMYLLSGILFFLVLFGVAGNTLQNAQTAETSVQISVGEPATTDAASGAEAAPRTLDQVDWNQAHEAIDRDLANQPTYIRAFAHRVADGIEAAGGNSALFFSVVQTWTPRLSFLLMPIFAVLLAFAFPFRKGARLFGHLIASMHFQTVMYGQTTLAILLGSAGMGGLGILLWVLTPPLYLTLLLRRVYASGWVLGVLRTGFLLFGSALAMALLVTAVFLLSVLSI